MIKCYLDDELKEPLGWVRTYTPDETIELLKTGNVIELSLDHDLGLPDPENGYKVLLWIEQAVVLEAFNPPEKIHVHSANSGARPKMLQAIETIKRLAKK